MTPGIATTPARRLRSTMAAARVSFTWMGTQKSLNPDQRGLAAQAFGAEGQFLSACKKLLDTGHAAFRAVTAIRGKCDAYWRGLSLPFPEPGVRLIRHDSVEPFAAQMADFRAELDDAVANLDRHYGELKEAPADRLGSLYNPADYPETLVGLFGVEWGFPSVEPPDYLVQLSPGLYEAERARVSARFEEAVQLAERAFLDEFARLVAHLTDRISGVGEDGQPRVFRDSAVENLSGFFARFREMNVRSDDQLDALVAEAQRAVRGVDAQDLRDGEGLRREVAGQLSRVRASLDAMLVDRPRRRILRQSGGAGGRRDGDRRRARRAMSVPSTRWSRTTNPSSRTTAADSGPVGGSTRPSARSAVAGRGRSGLSRGTSKVPSTTSLMRRCCGSSPEMGRRRNSETRDEPERASDPRRAPTEPHRRATRRGYMEGGVVHETLSGARQGGVISP